MTHGSKVVVPLGQLDVPHRAVAGKKVSSVQEADCDPALEKTLTPPFTAATPFDGPTATCESGGIHPV